MAASTNAKPGCQTNAWRILPGDFKAFLSVLDRIRAHQYKGFETGFRNVQEHFDKPKPARRDIEKFQLEFLGIHIFLLDYDPKTSIPSFDLIERVATGGAALGAKRLIISGLGLFKDGSIDKDALARKTAAIDRAGRMCLKLDLTLAYHNHDVEFQSGGAEIGELLKSTDRDLVRLMLDAGHAYLAGAHVPAFFQQHHRRIEGFHLRDFRKREQVPLGEGEFDLMPLAELMNKRGWRGWVINEEERPNDGRPGDEAVAPARSHLRKVFGV